jgi:hypothetical protein
MDNNKYKRKNLHWHTSHRFTLTCRQFEFGKLSDMSCLICNYLWSARYLFLSVICAAFLWSDTIKTINSNLTDFVIILFKSAISVYSPVRNTRNLDLYLFLIQPILELVFAKANHKSKKSNLVSSSSVSYQICPVLFVITCGRLVICFYR